MNSIKIEIPFTRGKILYCGVIQDQDEQVLIEDLLTAGIVVTACPSCGRLAGETCCCAIEISEERYEDIPAEMIKKAAYPAVGIIDQKITGG